MELLNLKEYKVFYYKTDLNLDEFNQHIEHNLINNEWCICEKFLHNSGLFFTRKRKSICAELSSSMELIFSQRNQYALISIKFYTPLIERYLSWGLVIILLAFVLAAPVLSNGYHIFETIARIVFIVSLLTGVALYGLYKSDKREIDTILGKVMHSSGKINLREYQRLLGD